MAGLDFADLLDAVAALPGLRRLRFVTSYPRDFTPRMVEQVARHANICPYLHLPVQSGSDRVLRRMGRGYTRARVSGPAPASAASALGTWRSRPTSSSASRARARRTSSNARRSSRRLASPSLFAFKYSPRPGTAALRLGAEVPDEVASRRLQDLFAVQDQIQRELNSRLVGETREVLVTGFGKQPGTLSGRTSCHRIVHFPVDDPAPRPGSLVNVRIDRAHAHSLAGKLAVAS